MRTNPELSSARYFDIAERGVITGVGTALLEALESWFRENDCLRSEVTSGDRRAQAHRFYESKGYVSGERRYLKRRDT